jgi:DNA-binding NarL/FixJ family response regulator
MPAPTATRPLRILLADDHAIVRQGIRLVLERDARFQVVAEAADGAEAVRLGADPDVDLAILDVAMPTLTGLQAARELSQRRDDLRILMLSMHAHEQYLFEALKLGASGYILKSSADLDVIAAVEATMRGEPFVYPEAMRAIMLDALDGAGRGEAPADVLTDRELQVVKLIAEAYTNDQIAEMLVISRRTVERHRENILGKLGMRDRVELTRYAIRRGLVEP